MIKAIYLSFLLILMLLVATGISGFRLKRNSTTIYVHQRFAWLTLFITVLSIILVEVFVRLKGGWDTPTMIMSVHITSGICYLLLLIGSVWKNGSKKPKLHRILVYCCFIFYFITFTTGMYVLANLT